MFRDDNLKLVTLIQNDIAVSYNLERLYENNLGFIINQIDNYDVVHVDFDFRKDLLQISLFAVYDAAIKFDFSQNVSYITYLKYWLLHYFHKEFMRVKFPFSITEKEYFKLKKLNRLADFHVMDLSYLERKDVIDGIAYGSLVASLHYEDFHRTTIVNDFWKLVKSLLTPMNYEIILLYFKDNLSYADIGRKYNIGRERVRRRIQYSLVRLKHSGKIQIIASDWYGIDVHRCLEEENREYIIKDK